MTRQPAVASRFSLARFFAGILLLIWAAGCNDASNSTKVPSPNVPSGAVDPSIADQRKSIKPNADGGRAEKEPRSNQGPESSQVDASAFSDPNLEIVIVPSKAQDSGRFAVTIRVTNRSSRPVGWDKECSSFIQWNVINEQGFRIEPSDEPVEKGVSSKERFVLLKPGETYSHSLDLVKGVRRFFHARAAVSSPTGESVVVPTGGELLARYEFGKAAGKLRLSIAYDSIDEDARDGFTVYFGFRPETVGIDGVIVRSNTFEISAEK